jgi:hypothetical protein
MRLAQMASDFNNCMEGVGRSMWNDARQGAFYGAIATGAPMMIAGGLTPGPKGAAVAGLKGALDGATGGGAAGAVHGLVNNIGECF